MRLERETPTPPSLRQVVERARQRAVSTGVPVLASIARRMDSPGDLIRIFATAGVQGQERTLFAHPSEGFLSVGVGRATVLQATGDERFVRLREAHQSLMSNAVVDAPTLPGVGPVCSGGFRFDVDGERSRQWQGFDDGMLAVPRLLFTRSPDGTWVTVNVLADERTDPAAWEAEVAAEQEALMSATGTLPTQPKVVGRLGPLPGVWRGQVERALRLIGNGRLAKVVLAQALQLQLDGAARPEAALAHLIEAYPGCLVFSIGHGEGIFLGATPERLVSLNNGQVTLTCLAGSAPRGATPEQDQEISETLMDASKERQEHAYVVEAARQALEPLCTELHWELSPSLTKLETVQHLATSFSGTTDTSRHLLELVERLHPTPAVGGTPRHDAMAAIREIEGFDRGWYAGPVGWLDSQGDGEFGIAIRCALLRGVEACLYAGAGIVAGSDPAAEWAELTLKLRPMLAALGGDA
jgi:isochorismate synthase